MVNNIRVKRDCCITKAKGVFILITNRRHTAGSAQELSQDVVHGSVLFEPPREDKLFFKKSFLGTSWTSNCQNGR